MACSGAQLSRGELARRTGYNSETILYFEKSGVLPAPDRTEGGHRRYDERHLRTLNLMARARGLGFTPKEVRALVGMGAPAGAVCDDVRALASERLELIRQKIADLKALETLLAETIGRCSGGATADCAVVDLLVDGEEAVAARWPQPEAGYQLPGG